MDRSKPIIMLDHQPTVLKEAEKAGVDLLLSGHTHHGQLAPANLITGMLYENTVVMYRKIPCIPLSPQDLEHGVRR